AIQVGHGAPKHSAHLKACSAVKPEFFAGPPLREFDTPSPKGRGRLSKNPSHSFAPALVSRLRISARLVSPGRLLSRANRKAVQPSLFFAFTFAPPSIKEPTI